MINIDEGGLEGRGQRARARQVDLLRFHDAAGALADDMDGVGEAANAVHKNETEGKVGVLCLAPKEGLGIDDPEFRQKVGEDRITMFRESNPATESSR